MREVFGEILRKKSFNIFLVIALFLYFRHSKCSISKSISVRGKKLLSADKSTMRFKKNHMIFLSYCPLKILKFGIAILQMQYLKNH